MKVLIVYGHPNPESFNLAVVGKLKEGLTDAGHQCELVDLYTEHFDPLVCVEDLGQFSGGQMPTDVLDQQRKVSAADAMIFVGPIHGWLVPAILKGWIDRVLSHGFAYELDENGEVRGLLDHKKALFIVTSSFPEEVFRSTGAEEAFRKIYLELTLGFMGIEDTDLIALYGVQAVGDEGRARYLDQVYKLGCEL